MTAAFNPIPNATRETAGPDHAGHMLQSLRRIIRSIDQHNRQISASYNMTVPQLVTLRHLLINGPDTPGGLARSVYLSQATITGILDRLEKKGLVARERGAADRRKVHVTLTDQGEDLARRMPWPLQERFAHSLSQLPEEEQATLDAALTRIVEMMEAPKIDVWPYGGPDDAAAEMLEPGCHAPESQTPESQA